VEQGKTMAISSDYPTPVNVNGFSCKNCTDVDNAKRHIDPAHPKDGPFGINAKNRPDDLDRTAARSSDPNFEGQAAVTFGGQLSAFADRAQTRPTFGITAGSRVDISV
jgi:hypothetical protein